jgi:hypothetical protein
MTDAKNDIFYDIKNKYFLYRSIQTMNTNNKASVEEYKILKHTAWGHGFAAEKFLDGVTSSPSLPPPPPIFLQQLSLHY